MAASPFAFPTDDHPMFDSPSRPQYDFIVGQLRQQYQDALDRINQEFQAAVERANKTPEPDQGTEPDQN